MNESENTMHEPGISVFQSQTSEAFMLIAFMIGDLLIVNGALQGPKDFQLYKGLNKKSYSDLKRKIFQPRQAGEHSNLTINESIHLYMLVDIACKSFVDDTNETLKKLAIENVKISEDEFEILRMNFLRYGQLLIEKMNRKFEKNELFVQSKKNLFKNGIQD